MNDCYGKSNFPGYNFFTCDVVMYRAKLDNGNDKLLLGASEDCAVVYSSIRFAAPRVTHFKWQASYRFAANREDYLCLNICKSVNLSKTKSPYSNEYMI